MSCCHCGAKQKGKYEKLSIQMEAKKSTQKKREKMEHK